MKTSGIYIEYVTVEKAYRQCVARQGRTFIFLTVLGPVEQENRLFYC